MLCLLCRFKERVATCVREHVGEVEKSGVKERWRVGGDIAREREVTENIIGR